MDSDSCIKIADISRCRGRPKTVPDGEQRQSIVETARQLFIEKGYGATTTDEIAARCKISKQTLYRLFPGKPALFHEVVTASRSNWLNFPVPDELPLEAALEHLFHAQMDDKTEHDRLELLRIVLAEGSTFPELNQAVRSCGSEISRKDLAFWLTQQYQRGRLKPCDAHRTADILMDMVYGAIVLREAGLVEYPKGAERRAHIRACIELFLHGLAA